MKKWGTANYNPRNDRWNKRKEGVNMENYRNKLGQVVRETWVKWAQKQETPKPSWLTPWGELNDGQKEVDQLIGETVCEYYDRVLYNEETGYQQQARAKVKQLEDRITELEQENERLSALAEGRKIVLDNVHPDLIGKQKITRLEDQIKDQATVINALNQTVGQLIEHIRKYTEASKAVIDTQQLIQNALNKDAGLKYVRDHIAAVTQLKQVASTKQAVDMGPYEAVDFVRLASHYVELREKALKVWVDWASDEEDIRKPMEELRILLERYTTPNIMPVKDISVPVQVTSVTITPHVKELIAMLEPDQEVEAVVYEKGTAVITTISAKLAALTQAVGEFLYNHPYQNTPGDPMRPYHDLCRIYYMLTRQMAPKTLQSDPVGYTTLKLKVLQMAAHYVIEAWNAAPSTPEGTPAKTTALWNAVKSLEAALNQTNEGRKPEQGKDLQVRDTY